MIVVCKYCGQDHVALLFGGVRKYFCNVIIKVERVTVETKEVLRTIDCKHCKKKHLLLECPPSEGLFYWCPKKERTFSEKGGDDTNEDPQS